MNQLTDENRKEARALLVQSKSYRIFALVFALVGFVVFVILYFSKVDGHVVAAFRNPLLIIMMLVPFLPAVVLAKKADKAQKQLLKLLEKPGAVEKKA